MLKENEKSKEKQILHIFYLEYVSNQEVGYDDHSNVPY